MRIAYARLRTRNAYAVLLLLRGFLLQFGCKIRVAALQGLVLVVHGFQVVLQASTFGLQLLQLSFQLRFPRAG